MKKITSLLIIVSSCFTLTGCFKNFYTVKSDSSYENLQTIMKDPAKKIVVHYNDETVAMQSAQIDTAQISGSIRTYLPTQPQYANPNENKRLQNYKFKDRQVLFQEVHVYSNTDKPAQKMAMVKKEDVIKYNTYKPAKGASIGSHVLGGAMIALPIFAVVAAVAFTVSAASVAVDMLIAPFIIF